MSETLVVNELFLSIQGEGMYAGWPCAFVRLTGCNLRCSYCDTAYAFGEGRRYRLEEILSEVHRLTAQYVPGTPAGGPLPMVEVTGGEPLLQPASLRLMTNLCDDRFTVLLETNGSFDIGSVDPRVHIIMDVKCPFSGEAGNNLLENFGKLRAAHEVKFVIATDGDYEWAKSVVKRYRLDRLCQVLFSWASPIEEKQRDPSLRAPPGDQQPISRRELAERILRDGMPVRFHAQLHKFIWPPDQRGV